MSFLRRLFRRDDASPSAAPAPPPNVLSSAARLNASQSEIATMHDVLDGIAAGRIDFATFVADVARNYYVQVAATPKDGLVAEAVADEYLEPSDRLGEAGAAKLRDLGYTLNGDGGGNWSREYAGFPHDGSSGEIEALLGDTLESVYSWTRGSPLTIKTGH